MALIECDSSLIGLRDLQRQQAPAGERAFLCLRQEFSADATIAAIPVNHEMMDMHAVLPFCGKNRVANRLAEMSDNAKFPFPWKFE